MKETLSAKQSRFAVMVGQLIDFAHKEGYRLTFGDAWAKTGHMDNSCHYIRLAVDFNLFTEKDGEWKYMTSTEAHEPLGIYWESIGGSWGGRFEDGNHYSLEHSGRR
jgi:hypothetical protein